MPAARRSRTKDADEGAATATTTKRRAKSRKAVEQEVAEEAEDEDVQAAKSTRRQITAEIVERAVEMREEGAKWTEIQEELGFNGAQLRPHIARLTEATIEGLEDSPDSVAEFRSEGYAWYAIAISLGKSVAEVKAMAEEGGAEVSGRVYRGNGAEAEVEDVEEDEDEDEEDEEPAPKRRSTSKTSAAKKTSTTRRKNPSKAA